jgi:hypothetical protein
MLLLAAAAAFACPNLDAEVERATTALVNGDYAGARVALDSAAGSFACAAATPPQLGRYWLVVGAVAQLGGDAAAARAPYSAARAVAPGQFDDRLGPKVRTAWSGATADGQGTLLLQPARPALLDGAPVDTWPAPVPGTPHVVQIVGADGTVGFGRVVAISAGEDALLEHDVPAAAAALADVAAPVEPKRRKSPALLILAGAAAVGAGACAGGALLQNDGIDAALTEGDLDAAFGRQQALGYSSYGLMGVAAVSLGVHVALP